MSNTSGLLLFEMLNWRFLGLNKRGVGRLSGWNWPITSRCEC
jgi:hypothetical protein